MSIISPLQNGQYFAVSLVGEGKISGHIITEKCK